MQLSRRPDESELDYHRRLVYGKLVDKTLADVDYSELSRYVYGQDYSSDVCRRMLYGSHRTLELMDETGTQAPEGGSAADGLDEKILELKKERQKFFDERAAYNKLLRDRSRQEELNEIVVRSIAKAGLPPLVPRPDPMAADIARSDNDLLVSLNDIHYGMRFANHWGAYDSSICAGMVAKYTERILEIAKLHKSENCIVFANGDLISGNIHYQIAVTNQENVIEQIIGVSELIASMLAILSRSFREVRYVSVAGNHSRIDDKDRALPQERLDDLVEWYLKARMQEYTNVVIGYGRKIDATMYVMDIRGKTYVGVHGDYDTSPSHIQALRTMVGEPIYAVLLGHLHHCSMDYVQGIHTVMAGSFVGMDDYCISKRIYGTPSQMVLVCDGGGILCSYEVPLAGN